MGEYGLNIRFQARDGEHAERLAASMANGLADEYGECAADFGLAPKLKEINGRFVCDSGTGCTECWKLIIMKHMSEGGRGNGREESEWQGTATT